MTELNIFPSSFSHNMVILWLPLYANTSLLAQANLLLLVKSYLVVSNSVQPQGLYSPSNSPGHNTGMGSHSLLQGTFPTKGSNPGLPHYRQILYQLSHEGSPRVLEWVAYPFSSRSSQARNRTGVSCIAGGFFTNWLSGKTTNPLISFKWYHRHSCFFLCNNSAFHTFENDREQAH